MSLWERMENPVQVTRFAALLLVGSGLCFVGGMLGEWRKRRRLAKGGKP